AVKAAATPAVAKAVAAIGAAVMLAAAVMPAAVVTGAAVVEEATGAVVVVVAAIGAAEAATGNPEGSKTRLRAWNEDEGPRGSRGPFLWVLEYEARLQR